MRKLLVDALRAFVALPDDDWQPHDWHIAMEAKRLAGEELARLDRAASRKPSSSGATMRSRKPVDGIPAANRAAVERRSGGMCEARTPKCEGRAKQIHHKSGKGFEGCHEVPLLLHVCGLGNASGCHGWIHDDRGRAEELGFMYPHGTTADKLGPDGLLHRVTA